MNIFSRFGVTTDVADLNQYTKLISEDMQDKINLWLDMVQGKASWNDDYKPSGVISAICGAIRDPISEEIQISSDNKPLEDIMRELDYRIPENVNNMCTCGGSLVRPIFANGKVQFELIKLGYYLPTKYDFDGTLLGAVILKPIQDNKKSFLLIEKHNFEKNTHKVEMELFRTDDNRFFKVPLSACSQTENLTERYAYENVEKSFIIELRNPAPNEIDFSNVPVAIYGGHENLIADCDRQYYEVNYEQIAGRTRVFADEDMFRSKQDRNGKSKKVILPEALQNVVVKLNGNGTAEEKITTHSPVLRTEQQVEAYQQILREVENVCRLGKGTLSNLQEAPQTATQFKGGKSVLYNTINAFETEIEKKYHDIAYVFAYMLSAYLNTPFNADITVTYDESDRKDASMQRQEDLQEVAAGILSKAEYRERHYGETPEEAAARVPETTTGGFVL